MHTEKGSPPGPAARRTPGAFLQAGSLRLAAALLMAWAGVVSAQPVPELRINVTAFQVEGDNPLSASETDGILSPYLGEQLGLAGLEAAADALEQAVRKRGFAFHRVILPPQRPEGGVIRLQVLRFIVGELTVVGNEHFSRENILNSIPALRTGETPNARAVGRSLAVANEHPSKRATVTMREGKTPDTVDAEVTVKDADPLQLFASLSNTGSDETGDYRLSLGAQHSNVFDRDHVVTASWTTSPDKTSDVNQYGVNYWAPIYAWGASVSAYATYSDVDSGRIADFFDVTGRGTFLGVRYTQALLKQENYSHKLTFGLDDRAFTNDVSFSGAPIGVDVQSRPLSLRYSGRWDDVWGTAAFYVEYLNNLDGGSDNTDEAYRAQPGAPVNNWDAWRMGADVTYSLPRGFYVMGRFRSQQAWQVLIPGEQFGLGGVNSVRGFEERATSGDRGYQFNLELWSPEVVENLRLLAFWDTGYRKLEAPEPGQMPGETLGSIGAGARWNWKQHLDVALDLGYVVDGLNDNSEAGMTRLHFSLLYRY